MSTPRARFLRRITVALICFAGITLAVGIVRNQVDYTQVFITIIGAVGILNGIAEREKKSDNRKDTEE